MIKDLEAEIVAVRNLAEVTANALIRLVGINPSLGSDHGVAKALEAYQEHRVSRFDVEVEAANSVLEKAWRSAGEEPYGTDWVPHELYEDLREAMRELDREVVRLSEENEALRRANRSS